MIELIEYLKANFANHADIIALVNSNCSYLMEQQKIKPPFIIYNILELDETTKDGSRNFELVVLALAPSLINLLTIYEKIKTVILGMPGYYKNFQGSTFPETDQELDGNFIIELTFNINT